jgi:DNA-binding LacI/PurR family transcriptional regulator
MMARPATASNRPASAVIGLLGSVRDELASRILDGMLAYAAAHPGHVVHDLRSAADADPSDQVAYGGQEVTGVVVAAPQRGVSPAVAAQLAGAALPAVFIGPEPPVGIGGAIGVDPAAIAALAVAHLTARRCRSFLAVGSAGEPGWATFDAAIQKATKGLAASYACPERLKGGIEDVRPLAEDRALKSIVERLARPIGVVCLDDVHAAALVRAGDALGLLVPSDIAVVGVGDTAQAKYATPPITSIRLPGEAMGARAMGLLTRRLVSQDRAAGSAAASRPVLLRVESGDLVPRESTIGHRADELAARHWLAYVRGRADCGATVSQMAAELCLPRRRFERQFTRLVGRAPSEELQRARIDRAKRLLADPMLTVTEVGSLLGFSETASFSRFFRKHTGKSPRDYRQQVQVIGAADRTPT